MKAEEIINKLKMQAHPEGGYFAEVYRSAEVIPGEALPERYNGPRPFSTSIYYLLRNGEKSVLHVLKSDETWHFYSGSPVKIAMFFEDNFKQVILGADLMADQLPQFTIPAGWAFGASPVEEKSFSLVGCTVAPGFTFEDFAYADTKNLRKHFPGQKTLINNLSGKQNEESKD